MNTYNIKIIKANKLSWMKPEDGEHLDAVYFESINVYCPLYSPEKLHGKYDVDYEFKRLVDQMAVPETWKASDFEGYSTDEVNWTIIINDDKIGLMITHEEIPDSTERYHLIYADKQYDFSYDLGDILCNLN